MLEVHSEDFRVEFRAPEIVDNDGSAVAVIIVARIEVTYEYIKLIWRFLIVQETYDVTIS